MNDLEFPERDGRLNPDELYLARGAEEISPCRPYLIGDVFEGVPFPNGMGGERRDVWPFCSTPVPCGRMVST